MSKKFTALAISVFAFLFLGLGSASFALADTLTAPANLTGTANPTSIVLNWSASTGGVAPINYTLLRNGVPVGNTSATTYTDIRLNPSTSYTYTVRTNDNATPQNVINSTSVAITTLAQGQDNHNDNDQDQHRPNIVAHLHKFLSPLVIKMAGEPQEQPGCQNCGQQQNDNCPNCDDCKDCDNCPNCQDQQDPQGGCQGCQEQHQIPQAPCGQQQQGYGQQFGGPMMPQFNNFGAQGFGGGCPGCSHQQFGGQQFGGFR